MTMAAALALHKISTVVLEQEPRPPTDWRASTFHAATLELLKEIDITDRMLAEGLVVPKYQFRDRSAGLIAEFDLSLLGDETTFPFRLQLNQQRLVGFLEERLHRDPLVELHFGARVTGVRDIGTGVAVTYETGSGPATVVGRYLVGADGASSTVRKQSGISFDGFTYEERFLIVSTPIDLHERLPGIAEVNYISDPVEWLFILRTPEVWRVLWPVPPAVSDEAATDPDEIQRHLQEVAPYEHPYPVVDKQIYRIHQRVADRFRQGRTALIGDAAHVNSPVGGVGLNSGIHDAFDLSRRLARIVHEGADVDTELDAFADVRQLVAREYIQQDTERNTNRLRETDPLVRRQGHEELRRIAADPVEARAWLRRVTLLESVRRFGIGLPAEETLANLGGVVVPPDSTSVLR